MHRPWRRTATGGLATIMMMSAGAAVAGENLIYDFASPYLQRHESITPGAGNAKELNAATHTIDPWPRNVGNRHIPGNGERMVGAVQRYRDVTKLPLAPQPILPIDIAPSGLSSSSGAAPASGGATK